MIGHADRLFGVNVLSKTLSSTRAITAFETTFQWLGTRACQVYTAFRSGWSKQANARCASFVSNWL
jgi:hypothetical protein